MPPANARLGHGSALQSRAAVTPLARRLTAARSPSQLMLPIQRVLMLVRRTDSEQCSRLSVDEAAKTQNLKRDRRLTAIRTAPEESACANTAATPLQSRRPTTRVDFSSWSTTTPKCSSNMRGGS